METNETVETAGNKMNDSEKIHLGLWNFLSVWAVIREFNKQVQIYLICS